MSVLVFDPQEAVEHGLNEAIVIQQMRYWLSKPAETREERDWIYNSYDQWQAQFPFWSVRTVRRTIESLEAKGLVISELRRVGLGSCKFYKLSDKLSSGVSKMDTPSGQNGDAINDQKISSEEEDLLSRRGLRDDALASPVKSPEPKARVLPSVDRVPPPAACAAPAHRDKLRVSQLPLLSELEAATPKGWCDEWALWRDETLIGEGNEMASTKVAGELYSLQWIQWKYKLSDEAMAAGLTEAKRRSVPNVNYVSSVAQSFTRRPRPIRSRDYDDEPLEQRRIL